MFGEKKREFYNNEWLDVEIPLKYEVSKKTALGIIEKYESITEADFWILKNRNKNKKTMTYSGLIISHNGCLKLNDELDEKLRFKAECVSCDKDGYGHSLVYTYCSPEQGLYEVGEASEVNLKNNTYPYAMAFKRLYDRVVLKNSKLAYGGIYSEVEADEFKEPEAEEPKNELEAELDENYTDAEEKIYRQICEEYGVDPTVVWKQTGSGRMSDRTKRHMGLAMKWLQEYATATGRN